MRVAIIGAGTAGICSAKHCLDNGLNVVVFEQTKFIGGTWVYVDETGMDENGLDIHTSMYKGLQTNFPKEIMGFPDVPVPDQEESYIPSEDVVAFLNSYAVKFQINDHIKFEHYVIRIKPKGDSAWEITYKDLVNDKVDLDLFDAVMVCNGHFNTPSMPLLPGRELFKGQQIHTHDYRSPDVFRGEHVLIMGGSTSAIEIAHIVTKANVAKSVTVSQHINLEEKNMLPKSVEVRSDIERLTEIGAKFTDGSFKEFTSILYCTGYEYSFPFISVDCGITVDEKYVRPLYKHCINIYRPTMALIGLPVRVCPSQLMDMQVRFFLKFLTGQKKLPATEKMLAVTENEMQAKWSKGCKMRHSHIFVDDEQRQYFEDLSTIADIANIKPVFLKLYNQNRQKSRENFSEYRKHSYKIVDDENFVQIK